MPMRHKIVCKRIDEKSTNVENQFTVKLKFTVIMAEPTLKIIESFSM